MSYPFSASATDDALACAYRFRTDVERVPDEDNDGSLTGTAFHALAEAYNKSRLPPAPTPGADMNRARRMLDLWHPWWDEYTDRLGVEWQSERPFAVDVLTGIGRELPSDGHRDYSAATASEVPGTVDALAVTADRVILADYKTGRADYITPACDSGQMRTLAVAAMRALGRERATLVIVPVSDLAPPTADEHEFDLLDGDLHGERLRTLVASIPTSEPTPSPACRFCPVAKCPERPAKYALKKRKKVA